MLNVLTIQYAKALAAEGILINAVVPGGCATDFTKGTPFTITITRTAEQGAEIAVRMATLGYDGPTGGFFEDDGGDALVTHLRHCGLIGQSFLCGKTDPDSVRTLVIQRARP